MIEHMDECIKTKLKSSAAHFGFLVVEPATWRAILPLPFTIF